MVGLRSLWLVAIAICLVLAPSVSAQVRIDARTLLVPVQVDKKDAGVQATANLHTTILSHATARALFEPQPKQIELANFPLSANESVTLKLERSRPVVDANSEIYTHTKQGKVPVKVRPVVSYRGTINGDPETMVSLHYSDADVTGFVQERDGHRVVIARDFSAPQTASATPHIIGEEAAMFGVDPVSRFICGNEGLPVDDDAMRRKMSLPVVRKGAENTQADDLREFKMAVVLREDIDSVMKRRGQTDEQVVQYFIKVIAAMAQVYEQELNAYLYMAYFEKFTTDEPSGYYYDGREPGELLQEFSNDWSKRMNNVDRTVAHLYALIRPVGGSFVGGIAFLDQLCNKKARGGYGVSTVYLSANDIPGNPNSNNAFVWD
ncbi:MAG: zinc-dependent metalloprotease family protein, partial [Candidatus Kapaibacterium sp.]